MDYRPNGPAWECDDGRKYWWKSGKMLHCELLEGHRWSPESGFVEGPDKGKNLSSPQWPSRRDGQRGQAMVQVGRTLSVVLS